MYGCRGAGRRRSHGGHASVGVARLSRKPTAATNVMFGLRFLREKSLGGTYKIHVMSAAAHQRGPWSHDIAFLLRQKIKGVSKNEL